MEIERRFSFDGKLGHIGGYLGRYDEPTSCPICKHSLKPQEFGNYTYKDNDNRWFLSLTYLCTHCFQVFVALHACNMRAQGKEYSAELVYTEPVRYSTEPFDDGISLLSPQFVKIYNQALAAESSGLDEIAGLGYRKAVEFLVKDFCTHLKPEDGDRIKALPLAKCISTYVDNTQIQMLTTRAVWIGNDEAHYIRKQENRDVSDMKAFIKAMVYFVGMVLIAEDAASMSPA